MTVVVPFHFDARLVRVVMMNGEPWWVAQDVCEVLDIANVSDTLTRLDEAYIGTTDVWSETARRSYRVKVVNESGLWDLVLDSRKPEAKRFRRWLTDRVLPEIRRTGSYNPVPQSFAEALELAAKQQRELEAANVAIAELEPKAKFHDQFMESEAFTSMTDLGDMYGLAVKALTGYLVSLGLFRKGEYAEFPGRRMPRKKYLDNGMFVVRYEHSERGVKYPVAYATPDGVKHVNKLFRENGLTD